MTRAKARGEGLSTRKILEKSQNHESFLRRFSSVNAADKIVVIYLGIICLLILFFRNAIEYWGWLSACHVVLVALVIGLAISDRGDRRISASHRNTFVSFIRGWYPIPLIVLNYKELTYLIPRIHPGDFDAALAAIDYRVFGVHPTVWLERFTWPPLTEILQLTYSTYYFLPIVLGAVLWRARRFDDFFFWVYVVMFGFYLSYLGYITVPAIGPRFLPSIVEAQTKPLEGVWLFLPLRQTLDSAEGITRDCFPSGHTELTLLVLYYARRFHRRSFWWLLPFGIGIIVSTVYLRYHYVIDVAAGALLAALVLLIANPIYRLLARGEPR